LAEYENLIFDNEYVIMSEVADNETVTQRELSKKLGISVSTVNVLMNKMIREGLIKMTQVSQKQVLYMLTPVGMMEKAKKTVGYLKAHYRAIYETKEKIKSVLDELCREHDVIYVLMGNDEMSEILAIAVDEYKNKHKKSNICKIHSVIDMEVKEYNTPILVYMNVNEKAYIEYEDITNVKVINLIEVI